MAAHTDLPLLARTWTLAASLAATDAVSLAAPPNVELEVRIVAVGGDAPVGKVPFDLVREGEVAIYDGDGDVYVRADHAVSIAIRTL